MRGTGKRLLLKQVTGGLDGGDGGGANPTPRSSSKIPQTNNELWSREKKNKTEKSVCKGGGIKRGIGVKAPKET